jgi:hypothetical protein
LRDYAAEPDSLQFALPPLTWVKLCDCLKIVWVRRQFYKAVYADSVVRQEGERRGDVIHADVLKAVELSPENWYGSFHFLSPTLPGFAFRGIRGV